MADYRQCELRRLIILFETGDKAGIFIFYSLFTFLDCNFVTLASVYVWNTKLYPYNYAEDFRNVKSLILFIIFAQNIDCGHAIPKKTTFPRQLAILNTKQCR